MLEVCVANPAVDIVLRLARASALSEENMSFSALFT